LFLVNVKEAASMKEIIQDSSTGTNPFLFRIYEDGMIASVNQTMIDKFKLNDCGPAKRNFFNLLHPSHLNIFKQAIRVAAAGQDAGDIEVYIKNGFYHPMKWQVSCERIDLGTNKVFTCKGYDILDAKKLGRFNQLVKKHYELIIEGLSGVLFHDKNGELLGANQKAAEIFNSTLENLYQLTNVEELWNKEWHVTDERGLKVLFEAAPFKRPLEPNEVRKETLIIQMKNGEKRFILFNSQLLPQEETDGQLTVISNIIDVTRERLLVRQLTDQEAFISSYLKQTPHLAWLVDEEATIYFASRAFYRYFNVTEKECIGKKMSDIVPDNVMQAVYKKHLEVFATGQPLETTEKIKWANGAHFVAYVNIFLVRTSSGKKLAGGQAVIMPDKSRLEKELHLAHERVLHMSKATSDAIWEWDMQTGQIFRNEALMEMVGYSLDNSKGLSWWLRRIHPEDRNRVADKVKEATDNCKQSWEDEYRFKCADGNYKHVKDKGFVVYENGLPVKMIGSLNDVSALKDLQNKLADVRLLQQQEISETVIRVQEKERTRIGHELHDNVNQVLSTAMLFLDMLNTDNSDQQHIKIKTSEYLKIAVEEIRKLSKELVTPTLKEEKLTDSVQILIDDIKIAGIVDIRFTYDEESNTISPGKKIALFRIIQEQLKNILKHSEATTVHIYLHTGHGITELVIEDDGQGFNSKMAHKGIGLSNMRERALFYNGELNIITSPGKGCRLIVAIPSGE
jgi:PAS domain S-box-containing protein